MNKGTLLCGDGIGGAKCCDYRHLKDVDPFIIVQLYTLLLVCIQLESLNGTMYAFHCLPIVTCRVSLGTTSKDLPVEPLS